MTGIGKSFSPFGTGKHNFGYIPFPPEPLSDEWYEEHCPRCKNCREYEENGKLWAECKLLECEFEEEESDE